MIKLNLYAKILLVRRVDDNIFVQHVTQNYPISIRYRSSVIGVISMIVSIVPVLISVNRSGLSFSLSYSTRPLEFCSHPGGRLFFLSPGTTGVSRPVKSRTWTAKQLLPVFLPPASEVFLYKLMAGQWPSLVAIAQLDRAASKSERDCLESNR